MSAIALVLKTEDQKPPQRQNKDSDGNPAMSPLLIINPLSAEGLQSLFRTHPSTQERIRRLLQLASQQRTVATV